MMELAFVDFDEVCEAYAYIYMIISNFFMMMKKSPIINVVQI